MRKRPIRWRKSGPSRAKLARPIRTGHLSRLPAPEPGDSQGMALRGRRLLLLSINGWRLAALLVSLALAGCMHMAPPSPTPAPLGLSQVKFTELAGWTQSDPDKALQAF